VSAEVELRMLEGSEFQTVGAAMVTTRSLVQLPPSALPDNDWASCSVFTHVQAFVTQQYNLVPVKGR